MEKENTSEIEIDLVQIIKVILRKWYWIFASVIVFGFVSGGYAYYYLDDYYTAESSMIVQVTNSMDSSYTDLLTGQRLVDTYSEIAKSNRVLGELRTKLGLSYSNSQLREMITVRNVNDTLIINLSVESLSPVLSKDIANEIVLIVQTIAIDFEGLENVEILDVAVTPTSPSGPNRNLYIAVGILLGGMLSTGIILAFEFLNKSIKRGRDIENILGLRLLGLIPKYSIDDEVN